MAKILDITQEELKELYNYILTMLGAYDIDVPLVEDEIEILACKALKNYLFELNSWQVRNQFSSLLGTSASLDVTNKFIFENGNLAQKISDWFASMARVGGKTPWKKDFFTLEDQVQIYDLSQVSSTPYPTGTRRIHKIMWVGVPEMFGPNFSLDAFNMQLFAFNGLQGGLTFGNSPLSYLGNIFDVELLGQSLRLRNKILRSEFFYNISGDIVEITPGPGSRSLQFTPGSKVFYYYFDEADFLGLSVPEQNNINTLISNPAQVKIQNVPYSQLNSIAKIWIDNYTVALSKYVLGAKYRNTKKIASPGSEYQIEFDWQSLVEESKTEIKDLTESLRVELGNLNYDKLMEKKNQIFENAKKINNTSPRQFFIG